MQCETTDGWQCCSGPRRAQPICELGPEQCVQNRGNIETADITSWVFDYEFKSPGASLPSDRDKGSAHEEFA